MSRRFAAGAVALALLAGGLAGCGGGDGEADAGTTTPAETAPPAGVAEAPIVAAAECQTLPEGKEFRVEASVTNPGDIPTLYAFTPTITKADGEPFFGVPVAVVVPPKASVPVIAGFNSNGVKMVSCELAPHDGGPFEEAGGVPWSEAAVDDQLLPALVRASVNADGCTDGEHAQCATDVTCDPAAGIEARCDITFVGGGTRSEVGAQKVVFDVHYGAEDGAFSREYIE